MNLLIDNPKKQPITSTFLFAHGAGAPMDSDFMSQITQGLVEHGIQVIRFEFPYMQKRRQDGKKRPPDRAPKLLEYFQQVIAKCQSDKIFIGGKSMGGRMASLVASQLTLLDPNTSSKVKGVVCLGYPFHAPGKPENVRNAHFSDISVPMLIIQGTRDAFGNREEVSGYDCSNHKIVWIDDGNHDLLPRKKSGLTHEDNLNEAIRHAAHFMTSL